MKRAPNMSRKQREKNGDGTTVELSVPWNVVDGQHRLFAWGDDASHNIDTFIRERSHVHLQYVVQENKTRRLALIISAALVITGSVILVYAPERTDCSLILLVSH
jgi:hypothetical protein